MSLGETLAGRLGRWLFMRGATRFLQDVIRIFSFLYWVFCPLFFLLGRWAEGEGLHWARRGANFFQSRVRHLASDSYCCNLLVSIMERVYRGITHVS